MRIRWAENPLASVVELTESEKRELRLKLEIEDLEERLMRASLHLEEKSQFFSLEKARSELDGAFLEDEEKRRQASFQERAESMSQELRGGIHAGDCTCVAMSCWKCYAESLAGADTLGEVGKHALHYVDMAFRAEGVETCEQAIAYLRANPPKSREPWMEAHIPRWEREQAEAIGYLERHAKKLEEQKRLSPVSIG